MLNFEGMKRFFKKVLVKNFLWGIFCMTDPRVYKYHFAQFIYNKVGHSKKIYVHRLRTSNVAYDMAGNSCMIW